MKRGIYLGVLICLVGSLLANVYMSYAYSEYFAAASGPVEEFHSGQPYGSTKVALIKISGTIMPPFTERIIQSIEKARDDDDVKAVLLVVDSPGGLVADSHQIYHRLEELRAKKPITVAMQRMAASGGLYVAMGAGPNGRIFAEPTTWTGSIGVIIPRYEWAKLAQEWGVESKPLKTGPYKDSLNPFRELSADEEAVWRNILGQSFEEFLNVIDTNRNTLTYDQVRALATGQIYTAKDALENGLIDAIGYQEDALKDLQERHQLKDVRVVTYQFPAGLMDLFLGSMKAEQPADTWQRLVDSTIPRAMYLCSWGPALPFSQ